MIQYESGCIQCYLVSTPLKCHLKSSYIDLAQKVWSLALTNLDATSIYHTGDQLEELESISCSGGC